MGDTRKEQFDLILDTQGTDVRPKKDTGKNKGTDSWYYFGIVGQIGFSIAIPIAGGALLGSFIDSKWNTYPRSTLGLLLIGVVISIITFYKTIKSVIDSSKRTGNKQT